MADTIYEPTYTNSWALVVGINQYQYASPLNFACNDAEGFADLIRAKFDFPKDNVILLKDGAATREQILGEFLAFADNQDRTKRPTSFLLCGPWTYRDWEAR